MATSTGSLRITVLSGLVVFLGVWLAGCGAAQDTRSADDAALWQGKWTMVSCLWNGQPQPGDVQWIVEGDYYRIRLNQQTHNDHYPFTLDPAHKRIDVNHHDTPPGTYGGKFKGIYEVTKDSLRVCYDLTGSKYPSSFDAGPGSKQAIYEFRREP